jgi:membrane-bound serine protease (ClpP class)
MNAQEWFLLFALAGLILFVAEVFLPGGVAGVAAAVCLFAAAVAAFPAFGFKGGLVACMLVLGGAMAFFALWVRILPRTKMGGQIILSTAVPEETNPLQSLIGKTGTAETRLSPAGVARVEGQRLDVVSDGAFLESGTPVRVVRVRGNHITVSRVEA